MGRISRSLDSIEKLVQEAHKTPQEQLKNIQEELKTLSPQKGFNNLEYVNEKRANVERYQILKEAETILIEQIEAEQNKKELEQIKLAERLEKQNKKEIKALLFANINYYFTKYPKEQYQRIYELLHDKDIIQEETEKITDIYGLEFKDFILSIYIETVEKVYKLYKYSVNKQKEEQKANKKRLDSKLKQGIAKDAAIIALLKLANKKKNYRK